MPYNTWRWSRCSFCEPFSLDRQALGDAWIEAGIFRMVSHRVGVTALLGAQKYLRCQELIVSFPLTLDEIRPNDCNEQTHGHLDVSSSKRHEANGNRFGLLSRILNRLHVWRTMKRGFDWGMFDLFLNGAR